VKGKRKRVRCVGCGKVYFAAMVLDNVPSIPLCDKCAEEVRGEAEERWARKTLGVDESTG